MRITSAYTTYVSQFYQERPSLGSKSYQEQYAELIADRYGWSDFWGAALAKHGIESWEPIGTIELMQKQWARENGISIDGDWIREITAAQVKTYRPDILFVNDFHVFPSTFVKHLRENVPDIKLVIAWCGAPYPNAMDFGGFDLILSNITGVVADLRGLGASAELMHHAFDPRLIDEVEGGEKRYALSFIGSVGTGAGFHGKRRELLLRLIDETQINLWLNIERPSLSQVIRHEARRRIESSVVRFSRINPRLRNLMSRSRRFKRVLERQVSKEIPGFVEAKLRRRAKAPLFGLKMFRALAESRMVLNSHIDFARGAASNMRMFEATGVGSCLLIERSPELSQCFDPDREVVAYSTVEELLEKVRFLERNPKEGDELARRAQLRTVRDHTFDMRADQLVAAIRSWL